MAVGQCHSEDNDGGIIVGQLLQELDRLAEFGRRLGRLAIQREGEVSVLYCQFVAELGDGGVVVNQRLHERDRLAVLGLRFRLLARVIQQYTEIVEADR